ncbi:phage baseplate assembly protein V [Methylobacter tundripaludum]|uniref:phage baseplate assembly protein V n=1 Tax=Methylobacter tundripaludum TaxID=173365 RepID=UPI00068E48BC|nr:phage baseplate assembly protein [Methylobacter tundripaludum]
MIIRAINKVTAPLARRVNLMVARGVLALVNDTLKMQGVQVKLLSGEVREIERFQNYGHTAVPLEGAEVAVIFVGGNRDHGIVISADDRRYRPKGLEPGEGGLYDDLGHTIILKRTGIVIKGAAHPINIVNCPEVIVTGGDVIADGISLKTHKHGGVTAGAAQTGVPV